MTIYRFEGIDDKLALIPFAARRAFDWAGLHMPLAGWRDMSLSRRSALVAAGTEEVVDTATVSVVLSGDGLATETVAESREPSTAPSGVGQFAQENWHRLRGLDRYVLAKCAAKGDRDRMASAAAEIAATLACVSLPRLSSHLNSQGEAHMVDVGQKIPSLRRAVARAKVIMTEDAIGRLRRGDVPKGDVLAAARIAGILGAKRTSELIPLCHPVALTHVAIDLSIADDAVLIDCLTESLDRTGVEMEALVGATTAALTVYDMLKSIDRSIVFSVFLVEKSGGRSGEYRRTA